MNYIAQPRDRWIPWYFVAFFLVVAAVNAVMVTLAIRTHTGIITEHPYEKGVAYNAVVSQEAAQEKLGWKGAIALQGDVLTFVLHDASGAVLHPSGAVAHMVRPTQGGMDFDVTLKDGAAHVAFPVHGIWDVRVFATVGKTTYQQVKRVVAQ